MGHCLASGSSWNSGYGIISLLQVGLTAILVCSLPLWQKRPAETGQQADGGKDRQILPLRELIRLPGVLEVMICYFCYCSVENSAMLWASSYLHLEEGVALETASAMTGMFCLGIALGRGINGFIAMRLSDKQMVRMGLCILSAGVFVLFLPAGSDAAVAGFVLIGLGCAPVYPCLMHATPAHFGIERSQAVIGLQMAAAHLGVCVMPPLFGVIARHFSVSLLPWYLFGLLALMIYMNERLNKKVKERNTGRAKSF